MSVPYIVLCLSEKTKDLSIIESTFMSTASMSYTNDHRVQYITDWLVIRIADIIADYCQRMSYYHCHDRGIHQVLVAIDGR